MPPNITSSINAMFHTALAHNAIAARVTFYHYSIFSPDISMQEDMKTLALLQKKQ
jgi:hypothetical protein